MQDPRSNQPLRSGPNPPSTITSAAVDPDVPDVVVGLRVSVRSDGDIDVVVLTGELDMATAPELTSAIDRQLVQGRNSIVLDLDAVTFFDARAIDAVITATCAAALAGGRLFVTHNPRFMHLLRLTCETHRVNMTEALRTRGPELRDVHSGTLRAPESADAVHAKSFETAADHEGSNLTRDAQLQALLMRSGEGDDSAFGALYDATVARAYGLGERLLRDPALAGEVVQETYLHLWEQSARFQPTQGSAISWILGTVHRCSVARMRPTVARVPADDFGIPISRGRRSPALGMLSPIQRRVIELAYYEGHTHTEVEELLHLPVGAGQTHIGDALAALCEWRRALQTPGIESTPP